MEQLIVNDFKIDPTKLFGEHHANRLGWIIQIIQAKKIQEIDNPSLFDFLVELEAQIDSIAFCLKEGYLNERDIVDKMNCNRCFPGAPFDQTLSG